MARSTRFLGCQYPLVKNPRGLLAQKTDVDQIKADILQLLLTNPGERVMEPNFGVDLRSLIFDPNDFTLQNKAIAIIQKALSNYEPRVYIDQVVISSNPDISDLNRLESGQENENILLIKISFFDPENISQINQLTLQIPQVGA